LQADARKTEEHRTDDQKKGPNVSSEHVESQGKERLNDDPDYSRLTKELCEENPTEVAINGP
jgi:hypothetical protein